MQKEIQVQRHVYVDQSMVYEMIVDYIKKPADFGKTWGGRAETLLSALNMGGLLDAGLPGLPTTVSGAINLGLEQYAGASEADYVLNQLMRDGGGDLPLAQSVGRARK
ncbi:hypothetical protein [Azospirillum sp. ST 5-10]|uniref:hypothetical protein n=1 Tax=unclassified Azospirillum TaxID=2630922 RepID=UPI003F4A695F